MSKTNCIKTAKGIALKEIARLHFTGDPYNVHALDVAALEELLRFQKIITKIATIIWKNKHPEANRLPNKFKKSTKFYFDSIKEGSAIVPIHIKNITQDNDMFNEYRDIYISQAMDLTHAIVTSANHVESLPEDIPQNVLQDIATLGKNLPAQAYLGIELPGKGMEPISENTRTHLMVMINNSCKNETEDIVGKILEVDVKRQKFELWIDSNMKISIPFKEEQESEITTALKEHKYTQVRVNINAEYNSNGDLKKILQLNNINIYNENSEHNLSAPSIMEEIDRIFRDVPEEAWNQLPTDLSKNHDFYIYEITELPSTIEEILNYIIGPLSPNKEYHTNYENQIVEWARKFDAVRYCIRCNSEPVVNIEIFQEKIMQHYNVPDQRFAEIYNVLVSLSNIGISANGIVCDRCEKFD